MTVLHLKHWSKLPSLLIIMMLFAFSSMQAQTAIKIPPYYDNNSIGSSNIYPLGSTTNRVQWIYGPGAFNTTGTNSSGKPAPAGAIYKVYFMIGSTANSSSVYNDFTLSLAQNEGTNTSFSSNTSWNTVTEVFYRKSMAITGAAVNGWVEFVLDKPFNYNPKNALVFEMKVSNSGNNSVNQPAKWGRKWGTYSGTPTSGDGASVSFGIDVKSLHDNDISISELVSPQNFCPGKEDIIISVDNMGRKQVGTFNVGWTLDGVAQKDVAFKGTLDTMGGKGSSITSITLATGVTFTANKVTKIKVWTSDPNGKKDEDMTNDTMTYEIMPSLSGKFTINKTGTGTNNFTSIKAFADALTNYGICGPVEATIANGTYNEQVTLGEVGGASSTNTITIDGQDSSLTKITSASAYVFKLDGADYVTIKNLTIEGTSTSSVFGLHLTNKADHNYIKSCIIKVPSVSSTLIIPFGIMGGTYSSAGDHGNYNTLDNCYLDGGYMGAVAYGTNTTTWCKGNIFKNNKLRNSYLYGMYTYYQDGMKILNNDVLITTSSSTYALYHFYCSNSTVDGNYLRAGYMGMYYYYNNYYNQTGTSTVSNNMITNSYNYGSFYGMYLYNPINNNIYHNSILDNCIGTGAYTVYLYESGTNNNAFNNNVIYAANTGRILIYTNQRTQRSLDYNNYYAPNGFSGYFGGTLYSSFAAYQSAANAQKYELNSMSVDPGFISTIMGSDDLHVDQTKPSPYGEDLGVKFDKDGDPRCPFAPTLGADENMYGKTNTKVQFYLPKLIYEGSPTIVTNSGKIGEPKKHEWYLNGKKISDSVTLYTTLFKGPKDELKLVTYSCAGKDSFTQTVNVSIPKGKPVSAFIASKNVITQGQTVKFTDLSSNGPNSWKWEISPEVAYVDNMIANRYAYEYGSKSTPSNTVRFDVAGKYKVCLTVGNANGTAAPNCVVDYVTVLPLVKIGDKPSVQDTAGYLYDNGGPWGKYSNNFNKGILIAPCASEVYITFSQFDLECGGDFLRIYDGVDNSGTQLNPCKPTGFTGGSTNKGCTGYCPPNPYDTFVAKSGKMYVEFISNSTANFDGFEAQWWSKPKAAKPPVANFEVSDSLCEAHELVVENLSTGEAVQYMWDFDGDLSTIESNDKNPFWVYFGNGKATITMIAYNCGGSDTMTKEVTIFQPSAPIAKVNADNLNPTTSDIVTLSAGAKQCVDNYRWKIYKTYKTGSSATYVNGTNYGSAKPQVNFSDTGCYTVELFTSNDAGKDSITKKCFITVKNDYCIPSVANMTQDVGISYVGINTISNTSSQAKTEYSNYTPTISTYLEIGQTYSFTMKRNTNANAVTRTVWIDLNGNGQFDEPSEKVAEDVNSKTSTWTTNITIPVTNTKVGASVMRVAINAGSEENAVCGQNLFGEYEDYRVYISTDRTAPVITLKGDDTMRLEQGENFTDPGATALDNLDGNITSKIKVKSYDMMNPKFDFDALTPGTYVFEYNVSDAAGNAAMQKRRIVIIGADKTKPTLVVEEPDTVMVGVFGALVIPQVLQAEDLVDGDLFGDVIVNQKVDVTTLGYYPIVYTVQDANGNVAEVTRWIWVADTTKPVLKLIGSSTVYHEVGTPYVDSFVVMSDNYYSVAELQKQLIFNTTVNENKLGTYTVTYMLADPSGNGPVTVTRTVFVVDRTAPSLTLLGETSMKLDVNTTYTEPGTVKSDLYDENPSLVISGSFYDKFPDGFADDLGVYTIVYTLTDQSGNETIRTREITVVDEEAPTITLKGDPAKNVCRWATYTDEGYDVDDNFWDPKDVTVTKEGSFWKNETSVEGMYAIRYKGVDKSGNIGYSEWRTIYVKSPEECGMTSITETASLENRVHIYPNPSNGSFMVTIDGKAAQASIRITNLLGQEVNASTSVALDGQQISVDMRNQSAGVYVISITTKDGTVSKKLTISK